MKKEDLKNYTKDELDEMFVNLINEMENAGNEYMKFYKIDDDLCKYTYAAALLTRVNRVRAMVLCKNQKWQWQENTIVIWDEKGETPVEFIVNEERLTPEQYHEKYPLEPKGELKEINRVHAKHKLPENSFEFEYEKLQVPFESFNEFFDKYADGKRNGKGIDQLYRGSSSDITWFWFEEEEYPFAYVFPPSTIEVNGDYRTGLFFYIRKTK